MTDNQKLLAEYARTGSETAFREIVSRYVDLVYSTALRLVGGDTHRAQDVAQTVFVDLARVARTLPKDVKLGGWLHRDTCFAASTLMRGERRRQFRERRAVEMNALQDNSGADFSLVAPILDEAINELGEADRAAILLRFFEQRDFRAVGQALGGSEDAARMRVNRALEKLESLLKRRNITTSSAALAAVLGANAVQAAPAGLAAAILSAAALAGTTIATGTATATATKVIAMTALQKTLIATTLIVAAGSGIYEARQASNLWTQVQTLQQQQAPLAGQIQQLRRERDDATNRLALLADELEKTKSNNAELLKLRSKVAVLQNAGNDPSDIAAKDLVARVNKLKQRLEQTPDAKIPELQLLNDQDWLTASRGWNLDTEGGFRQALSALRGIGGQKFANQAQGALARFFQANNKQYPADLAQLQPYFDAPVDAAILQRWEILPAGTAIPGFSGEGPFITEKAPVDGLLDTRFAATLNGYASSDFLNSEIQDVMMPVYQAYSSANNGLNHDDPSQLLPYATTPEQQAAVQKLIQQSAARK